MDLILYLVICKVHLVVVKRWIMSLCGLLLLLGSLEVVTHNYDSLS